jgi:hypothetical protein
MLSSVGAAKLASVDKYFLYGFVGIFACYHVFYLSLFAYKLLKHKRLKKEGENDDTKNIKYENSVGKNYKLDKQEFSFSSFSKTSSQIRLIKRKEVHDLEKNSKKY